MCTYRRTRRVKCIATAGQRGQIAVMFALLMPVLLGLVGLVVDGGLIMVQFRRGQVTLDSAALAAATQLDEETFSSENLVQLNPSNAYLAATRYAQENGQGQVSVTGINVSGAQVDVYGTVAAPTIFMRIFGINRVRLNLSASAELKYGITEEGQ
jgi:Flp pilus assembly protein TadG